MGVPETCGWWGQPATRYSHRAPGKGRTLKDSPSVLLCSGVQRFHSEAGGVIFRCSTCPLCFCYEHHPETHVTGVLCWDGRVTEGSIAVGCASGSIHLMYLHNTTRRNRTQHTYMNANIFDDVGAFSPSLQQRKQRNPLHAPPPQFVVLIAFPAFQCPVHSNPDVRQPPEREARKPTGWSGVGWVVGHPTPTQPPCQVDCFPARGSTAPPGLSCNPAPHLQETPWGSLDRRPTVRNPHL